jgi:hypothetical protein
VHDLWVGQGNLRYGSGGYPGQEEWCTPCAVHKRAVSSADTALAPFTAASRRGSLRPGRAVVGVHSMCGPECRAASQHAVGIVAKSVACVSSDDGHGCNRFLGGATQHYMTSLLQVMLCRV